MQDLGIISPSLEEFRELAGHSRVIPVRLKVLADAETPIGLYRKLAQGQPGTFLMESAAVGGAWSRYSFIGARSRATLTTKDGQAHWLGEPPVGVPLGGSPVDAIRDTVEALRTDRFEGLPPVHLRPGRIPRLGNRPALGKADQPARGRPSSCPKWR